MSQIPRPPWHQLQGESDADYVRFLFYLSQGFCRNVTRAYRAFITEHGNGRSPQKPSNHWWKLVSKFDWKHRASQFDIHQLQQQSENLYR